MAECSILDLPTGGDLLPYVYCNKITLETPVEATYDANGLPEQLNTAEKTKITLDLEILQSKNDIGKSTWLTTATIDGKSILDYMYIQVVPLADWQNIRKLHPQKDADEKNSRILRYYG